MTAQDIQNLASLLGFQADLSDKLWTKTFSKHSAYSIRLDFAAKRIDYGKKIILGDETTSNFSQPENFVVLECVCRLLEKGYEPQHIELERKWSLGRTQKSGKADIVVSNRNGEALIIIECKTAGVEYEKEKERMKSSGGQLFSYYQQDQNATFLCLYASEVQAGAIVYENAIVHIQDRKEVLEMLEKDPKTPSFTTATNAEETHKIWKEQFNCYFAPNGIFDDEAQAYNPEFKPIKRKDLKPFTDKEGQAFFNQFAEILRHNNISDQSNAFNRILSLILCKIVDERRAPNEQTDFQVIEGKDTPEEIQDRLQRLYAAGMKEFLREEIVYFSMDDIKNAMEDFPRQYAKERIHEMFRKQKFYSNNEFAFKEIHNEKLFLENAKALNEIILLLQYKLFRYERSDGADSKQTKRYLGDFFELLLSAGYKQTAGQFFTPLPIAKFILTSLPLRAMTERKIAAKKTDFLPRTLDYACGSGHFLTEAIEEIQTIVDELQPDTAFGNEVNTALRQYQETDWTGRFLYGVEKDYRLARTAKIACFMNGDGEANIIFGDGLEDYRNSEHKMPPAFDVIVANPPFSIEKFKAHLNLKNDFTLLPHLTDNASEIEVLFVERTAQALQASEQAYDEANESNSGIMSGMAGVILPSSILSNGGIYTKAREVLLRNFEIRAIVEFGSKTFMATGTSTVALFLVKRHERWAKNFALVAEDFIKLCAPRTNDFMDTASLLDAYAARLGLTKEDYCSFLTQTPSDALRASEWYATMRRAFENSTTYKNLLKNNSFKKKPDSEQQSEIEREFYAMLLPKEQEKFEFFCLASGQNTLIVRAPQDNAEEKAFLGYEFSNRRGDEGIKITRDAHGKHQTALYDEDNPDNPQKLNTLVRAMLCLPEAFRQRTDALPRIPDVLATNARVVRLVDCLDFSREEFDKQVSLAVKGESKREQEIPSLRWNMARLGDVAEIISGGTPDTKKAEYWDGGIYWATLVDTKQKYLRSTERTISQSGLSNSSAKILPVNTVLFSSRATIGDISIAAVETCTNQGYKNFICKPEVIHYEYLYYVLKANIEQIKTLASGMTYAEISKEKISAYKIPLPPLEIQEQIVAEMQAIEQSPQQYWEDGMTAKEFEKHIEELKTAILKKYLE
ncbi:MAG: restriction endonuclease subunit S [Candidatus Kapaibacteriota bacterium]